MAVHGSGGPRRVGGPGGRGAGAEPKRQIGGVAKARPRKQAETRAAELGARLAQAQDERGVAARTIAELRDRVVAAEERAAEIGFIADRRVPGPRSPAHRGGGAQPALGEELAGACRAAETQRGQLDQVSEALRRAEAEAQRRAEEALAARTSGCDGSVSWRLATAELGDLRVAGAGAEEPRRWNRPRGRARALRARPGGRPPRRRDRAPAP